MGFLVELVIIAVTLLGVAVYRSLTKNKDYWTKRGVPNIKLEYGALKSYYYLFTGQKSMFDFEVDTIRSMKEEKFAGNLEMGKPIIFFKDLELIKQVLVKDFDHFVDRRKSQLDGEPALHNMLTLLEGQEWKNTRSTVSPTFTTGKIRRMFQHFNRCGEDLVEFIKRKPVGSIQTREAVIKEFVHRYLVDVVGATAFGMDTGSLKDPNSIFYKMAKRISEFSMVKALKTMLLFLVPCLGKIGVRFGDSEALDFFQDIVKSAIKHREESGEKRDDFLQMMMEARKGELKMDEGELEEFEKNAQLEKGGKGKVTLSDDVILAQCLLFFIAGIETTGSLLCFAYYLLALHPDIQEKIYEEVSLAMEADGDKKVTYEAIAKMEYMDKFIAEILRKYPFTQRLDRRCTKEYKIPGTSTVLEKDVLVCISIIGLHHSPDLFPNPEIFDPERFTPEAKAARNPFSFLPFGNGPRSCIGMRFALMSAKVAIAYIVQNFVIEPSAQTPVPLQLDRNFAGRPDPSVTLMFKERSQT